MNRKIGYFTVLFCFVFLIFSAGNFRAELTGEALGLIDVVATLTTLATISAMVLNLVFQTGVFRSALWAWSATC